MSVLHRYFEIGKRSMSRRPLIIGAFALIVVTAIAGWWSVQHDENPSALTLYGDVDLRQVELPFNGSERIAAVLVQEGDQVQRGQVLARLDTSRLIPEVAQAEDQVASQSAVVDKMHHGNRPEEIGEARANLADADADATQARGDYERMKILLAKDIISRQGFDSAKAASEEADAKAEQSRKAFELEVEGPRQEDIDQAEAQLRANQAQLALLRQQLADGQLVAPLDAVVRSRLMEPGEMASPAKPVFSLAITDPKWVRTYVSETELGVLYLLVTLGIGLLVSSVTRSQFVASQLALVISFLPAMMLSGFLFDLRSAPLAVRLISYLMPARYYVSLLQTIFLAGNIWSVVIPNATVLAVIAAAPLIFSRMATHKRLA